MAYWQDRMAKAQDVLTAKRRKEVEKQLRKYYRESMEEIIASFENTYNKILNAVEDGKQPTPADLYKLDSYWKMQAQLRQEMQKLGEKQIALLSKNFELNFFDVYYSIALDGVDSFSTLDTAMVTHMINQIWCADGKSWSERVWDNTARLAETLNEELIHCVATGKKTTELKKILQERFNVSYTRADTLARTELAHIQTQAAKTRYDDAGVKEVEIWADADERRCDICAGLHQKRYPINGAIPIPAHPRCRCCILPIVE